MKEAGVGDGDRLKETNHHVVFTSPVVLSSFATGCGILDHRGGVKRSRATSVIEVLAITNNLQQASFRLRLQVLLRPLEKRGVKIHVEVRPRRFFDRRQLLKSADRYDAVLIQRKLLNPSDSRCCAAGETNFL